MIYEVTATDQADADLRDIYKYIAFELLSPEHAAVQLERLEEHITGLERFPERCVVAVIRVMYAGRDVDSQLKD